MEFAMWPTLKSQEEMFSSFLLIFSSSSHAAVISLRVNTII